MKEPQWLLKETVLALHERLLSEFGGLSGLRDEGLLDSALARPMNCFAYEKAGIFELAAAYANGLIRNHPFLDGNKRIGFAAAAVFLEINDHRLIAAESDATVKTLALAARAMSEKAYAEWLREIPTAFDSVH